MIMTKPNPYIEVVKKWLADPKSVSQKELEDNREATYAADVAARDAATSAAYLAATVAAYLAATAAATAAANADTAAAYWVRRYEELTND